MYKRQGLKDDWRGHKTKTKGIRNEIEEVIKGVAADIPSQWGNQADVAKSDHEEYSTSKSQELVEMILKLVENQDEY